MYIISMCGVNGFNFRDENLVQKMDQVTAHRGPDQSAFWCDEKISLGHNRLAIIDLSPRGVQPMWDAAHEVVIVFNGEIYNYQELRSELEVEYQFNSQSDTEVILNAYKKYGAECLNKFNGIFAFAIWDTRTEELFLTRDRMGVKPLYYFFDGARFIFSSEIKGILEHVVSREVDRQAFNLFFQLLYVPEPLTMFKNILKLPAAHYAILKENKLEIKKYWDSAPDFLPCPKKSYQQTVAEIRETFRDSVKHQLISDRPVGIFLSGGLDSTAVLGAAVEFHSGPIKTFSVGFKDSIDPKKFNADFDLARQTAAYYKTDHHELLVGPNDIWNEIEQIVWHLDEPNFNPTAGAIYLLSKYAKQSVAVVLGGDGADELFGGYPRYYYSRLMGLFLFDEKRVLRFLAQKSDHLEKIISANIYHPTQAAENLQQRYFINAKNRPCDFENYFMRIDREGWLADESRFRSEKMTMANGVEARVPILDYRLVKLSETIPVKWKFNLWQNPKNFQGKKIWKEAIKSYLPEHVLNQQKRGWFTPMAKWLRGELRAPVYEILQQAKQNITHFNPEGIEEMWQKHLTGQVYNLNSIWAIVMWQLWYNKFFKKM